MGKRLALAMGGLVALAAPASAHHSFAMFDRARTVTITGDVTKFEWTNPHSWLHVQGTSGSEPAKAWSIEMTSPNILVYKGWRPNSVKPGERITVTIYPLRDGSPGGAFVKAVTASGKVLTQEGKAAQDK
jgi:hypothetical protein